MVEKIAFTKEEIESRVKVPAIVEVELKHLIEERLKQSGLYYRIFSRIKTSESLARKYQVKSYNADKKIQDLVGLRVDVYFEDDLRICRQMMERPKTTFVKCLYCQSPVIEDCLKGATHTILYYTTLKQSVIGILLIFLKILILTQLQSQLPYLFISE